MATIASPTPLGSSYDGFARRPARPLPRTQIARPNLKRGSPLSNVALADIHVPVARRQNSVNDSSDDEGSVPLLSAAAEELLGVKTAERPAIGQRGHSGIKNWSQYAAGSPIGKESFGSSRMLGQEQTASPMARTSRSPRVVRLSSGSVGSATLRRTASTSSMHDGSPVDHRPTDIKTPGSRPKSALAATALSSGNAASSWKPVSGSPGYFVRSGSSAKATVPQTGAESDQDAAPFGSTTMNRSRNEEYGAQSSLRVKRVGKVTGRFLSGPARRGMIRRQSEEDHSPIKQQDLPIPEVESGSASRNREAPAPLNGLFAKDSEEPEQPHVRFASSALLASVPPESAKATLISAVPLGQAIPGPKESHIPDTKSPKVSTSLNSSSKRVQPVFRVSPLPNLPSRHDQENEPPPTFKRNRPGLESLIQNDKMANQKLFGQTPSTGSPLRVALAPRSQNTPLRPAPPPPKMSVLETATATVGAASTSQVKKKRNYISVNGKLFTRMECIGRGGSGRVYRVMAENFKLFALKRVSLEDVDEMAIRGFKGEIELLRKLEKVDRVVRLYDFEINDERKTLSVLMDIGELDLKKVLDPRLDEETGKFDITFTRYVWKEMLECVQAVHAHDIVHSDLKPANFVLMQGRLKLIDFGIANAIQDDTVNVHREQQIGTPNYMAPETLRDANAKGDRSSSPHKVMKLGKPSDVWSLGCILYQIVYGKPPFGHLASSVNKVMAITDDGHVIAFPQYGLGKVLVPTGLIRTMKRCLRRDQAQRPTVEQLLAEGDAFLHPDVHVHGTVPVSQELIGRIQHNIINHVREHGIPSDAEMAPWPGRFFASIRAAVEEGRA